MEGEQKSTKFRLAMEVTIGGDAAKSGKDTHLLVVMRMRLLHKIGPIHLINWTQFKKGNRYKIHKKIVHDYWGMRLMINKRSVYYWHTNPQAQFK